jgi:N utilization substance protein A
LSKRGGRVIVAAFRGARLVVFAESGRIPTLWHLENQSDGQQEAGEMQVDLVQALRDLGKEKGIPVKVLGEILEAALISAYKRHFGASSDIHVEIDWEDSVATVFMRKLVVEHVENPHTEISVAEARRMDPAVEVGETMEIAVEPTEFGRIAAQTAKQVVVQRIREVERKILFDEFSGREGEVATGIVQRREGRTVYVSLGKVEAVLPPQEQSPLDGLRYGDRLKILLLEVKETTKAPRVLVSRSHPGLVRRLFELEVPEVHEGVVEVKAIAREAGARTKIAVSSRQENVDPVGACVGHRGSRVQAVVDELRGEKIDIIRWSTDATRFITQALSPAKVGPVIVDEENLEATVIAPDNQLSLAIGREGQNVRLAVRLTGYRIDIKGETQQREEAAAGERAEEEAAAREVAAEEAAVGELPAGEGVSPEVKEETPESSEISAST